jgi:hypothetical protein
VCEELSGRASDQDQWVQLYEINGVISVMSSTYSEKNKKKSLGSVEPNAFTAAPPKSFSFYRLTKGDIYPWVHVHVAILVTSLISSPAFPA